MSLGRSVGCSSETDRWKGINPGGLRKGGDWMTTQRPSVGILIDLTFFCCLLSLPKKDEPKKVLRPFLAKETEGLREG